MKFYVVEGNDREKVREGMEKLADELRELDEYRLRFGPLPERGVLMPTYYVEDYDGERNDDAVDRLELKVVTEEPDEKPAPKKTARAQTKGK